MLRPLIVLIVDVFLLLAAPLRWRRRRNAARGCFVSLTLSGKVAHVAPPPKRRLRLPWLPKGKAVTSLLGVRELCERLAADPLAPGLLLTLSGAEFGWAAAESLREALALVRAAKKRVVVFLPKGGGLRDYFIASVASDIAMAPAASLHLVGIGGTRLYLGGALARLGVEAEVEARHEYKSAGETFSRGDMSPSARAQTTELLGGLSSRVEERIGERIKGSEVGSWLGSGPYRAARARELGLIDHVCFADGLGEVLDAADKHGRLREVSASSYDRRRRSRLFMPLRKRRRVGLVLIGGTIVDEATLPSQKVAATERIVAALHRAESAEEIGAVVLVVDSPGGSAFASAVIHRSVQALAKKKPVVAFLGDVAASGGYYVAAPCHEIVAGPMSLTGSIGVVSIRPVIDAALEKLGIRRDGVTLGAHAGLLSLTQRWSDAERAAMKREIDAVYDEFVAVVAAGRKKTLAEVDSVARGRVFLGQRAVELGLVDALGGVSLAIDRARALSKVEVGPEAIIVAPPRGPVELPSRPLSPPPEALVAWLLGADGLGALVSSLKSPMLYEPLTLD